MVDYSMRAEPPPPQQPPPPPPPPGLRPSTFDSLKHAAGNPAAGWVGALVMLVTAVTTALKTADDAEAKTRLAYETLAAQSERHGVQIEQCRQSQLQQTAWIEQNWGRLERQQEATEQTIATKVAKPKARPVPPPVVEPAPKAPPAPAPLEPTELPTFDALELRSNHDS